MNFLFHSTFWFRCLAAFIGATPVILGIITFLERRFQRRLARLETKLRRALKDCRAFYEIEARFCADSAAAHTHGTDSPLSVQKLIRESLRRDGMESPSDDATPHRIAQELEKLSA